MNFFEQQQSARRQSRWLIFGFIVISLIIVIVVDLVVMAVLSLSNTTSVGFLSAQNLNNNWGTLLASSGGTAGIISISSLGKIASLRSGGGKVAKSMGATVVSPDVRDPLRRRYYNVVEEIAIASGVPVPEIYVMENESGINAFAAGYSSSDAAIAVTQGALEKLNRAELQGVIAHEFSHILNGDMRINIRLMGVLFGILIAAVIGRKLLSSGRYIGRGSRDGAAGIAVIFAAGAALMLIGYIGLFFARLIKAKLSQQREYLADASAVQFTRDPDGIGGALKKIAAYGRHSHLQSNSEEVSHMLFGSGRRRVMFATHPPILQRIQRIEPAYTQEQLDNLAKRLRAEENREHLQAKKAEKELKEKKSKSGGASIFNVGNIIDNIGNPDVQQILAAAVVVTSIPDELTSAAHSVEWAPEILLYCLLDSDPKIREQQLLIVAQKRGDFSLEKMTFLLNLKRSLAADQRLPLMEMAFPALKQRPENEIEKLIETVDLLANIDGKVATFEYLLARQISQLLNETKSPGAVVTFGNKRISHMPEAAMLVLSVLAQHGHEDLESTQEAFQKGAKKIKLVGELQSLENWQGRMDEALSKLNNLRMDEKKNFVLALSEVAASDGKIITEEYELLRTICASLHVPLPVLQQQEA